VSEETGNSAAQVALAWLRTRRQPIIPLMGTRKLAQLQDNLESLNVELGAEHLERLDGASRIELGFPHDFYEREMVCNFVYAGLADRLDNH
jgi:aryl-alcohol dehydrogenase-like predicted oxidoreductase